MNLNKKVIAASLTAAFLSSGLLMAGQAEARPGDNEWRNRNSYESVYQALTPEKQAQFDAIMKEYVQKTAPLRDKLQAKYLELRTLGNSANPDSQAVSKISEEIVALRGQLRQERQAMADKVAKDVGINITRNRGYGYHHRGSYGCPGCGDSSMGMGSGYRMMHPGMMHQGMMGPGMMGAAMMGNGPDGPDSADD